MQPLFASGAPSPAAPENGLDLLVQQLFSLVEESPARENYELGDSDHSSLSRPEHKIYKVLVDETLKEVCADFMSLLALVRKHTLMAVGGNLRRGGRVTEVLADLQDSLHRQFNATAIDYIERLTFERSGENPHANMLGKRGTSDGHEGSQQYVIQRNPDFVQLKAPSTNDLAAGLTFRQPPKMKVENDYPKTVVNLESQQSTATAIAREVPKIPSQQLQRDLKKDIFLVKRPVGNSLIPKRPTGSKRGRPRHEKPDSSRRDSQPIAKSRIGSNSRAEVRITRSKSSKSGGYSAAQLAWWGRGKMPVKRGGSVDTAGRTRRSDPSRGRDSISRGREVSSRETSLEIGKSTQGSSHIRSMSGVPSALASGYTVARRIGRLERQGEILVRKSLEEPEFVDDSESSDEIDKIALKLSQNGPEGLSWEEQEKIRKDRRNERDWIKRQSKLGIKIDSSSLRYTHTVFEKDTCKLYAKPGEKSFTFYGKYGPETPVGRVTEKASNRPPVLEQRLEQPSSGMIQEENLKPQPEGSVREESESGTKSGASLGKRELKAPRVGGHKKATNRNSYLDQDEQNLLEDSKVMHDTLELLDHGDYFPMVKPNPSDDSEDMIFKVDKISPTDYVLCRQEYSILYRKQDGVPPVSLPHPKEQLLNFKAYKETTWILVNKKIPSTATLGLKIIDMTQLEKKLPHFVLEEILTGPTILLHQDHLFAIKHQGIFAYNLEELTGLLKTNNARSYVPKLVYSVKKATDCCIEGTGLFAVCDHSNVLHRVDLTSFAAFANDTLAKLPSKSSALLSDDVINENYITNTRIKSLEGDVVVCTTNKLVLVSEAGVSQDQYSSKNMIDMCIFKHNQNKFVLALHRREDVSMLRIYNGGFFVIMRLLALETDKSLYQGILHLNDFEFLVYGDKGYCKHFELRFDRPAA